MNVVGLNDLFLRSLTDSHVYSGATLPAMVYLFRGNVPSSLEDLPFELDSSAAYLHHKELAVSCNMYAPAVLSVDRATAGKVKLKLTNGNTALSRDEANCFKGRTDISYSGYTMVPHYIHYMNNFTSVSNSTPALPAMLTKAERYANFDLEMGKGRLSHKFGLNSIYTINMGSKGEVASSSTGGGAVIFHEAVWADFVTFNIHANGTASATRSIQYVQILDENDVWQNAQSGFSVDPNRYIYGFTRRKIKGMRILSGYQTQGFVYSSYYLSEFAAGIRNFADLPEFNANLIAATPITWAIIKPESDATTRATAFRAPIMMVEVGNGSSNAQLKMTDPYSKLCGDFSQSTGPFVANQTILELDV